MINVKDISTSSRYMNSEHLSVHKFWSNDVLGLYNLLLFYFITKMVYILRLYVQKFFVSLIHLLWFILHILFLFNNFKFLTRSSLFSFAIAWGLNFNFFTSNIHSLQLPVRNLKAIWSCAAFSFLFNKMISKGISRIFVGHFFV